VSQSIAIVWKMLTRVLVLRLQTKLRVAVQVPNHQHYHLQ